MSDGNALLNAILAHPAEDTPRLVYADWLQEHGDDARAEFIRVQCELARAGSPSRGHLRTQAFKQLRREQERLHAAVGAGRRPIRRDRRDRLWARANEIGDARFAEHEARAGYLAGRERELLYAQPPCLWDFVPWVPSDWTMTIHAHKPSFRVGVKEGVQDVWHHLRRGFAEEIECAAADWLAHADAILAAHPVRKVRLTTMPSVEFFAADGLKARLAGRSVSVNQRRLEWQGRDIHDPQMWHTEFELLTRLLEAEWSGVEFDLPLTVAPGAEIHAGDLVGLDANGNVVPIHPGEIMPLPESAPASSDN